MIPYGDRFLTPCSVIAGWIFYTFYSHLPVFCLISMIRQTFIRSALEPKPPVISLLTMIRLSENVVTEVQKRRCPPGEHFIFSILIQMWPLFRESMSESNGALKKLAEGTSGGYFSRATVTTDVTLTAVNLEPKNHIIWAYVFDRCVGSMLCFSMPLCTWPWTMRKQWFLTSMSITSLILAWLMLTMA